MANKELLDIMDYQYRGLCKTDPEDKSFCKENESFSFFTVTIVFPAIGLILLYIPSAIYIIFIYTRKKKWKQFNFFYGIVCFIFALLTNLSLFGEEEQSIYGQEHIFKGENFMITQEGEATRSSLDLTQTERSKKAALTRIKMTRSRSLPTLFHDRTLPALRSNSLTTINFFVTPDLNETKVHFSPRQSEATRFSLDLTQTERSKKVAPTKIKMTRSQSLPTLLHDRSHPVLRSNSLPTNDFLFTPDSKENKVHFSLRQSNVLFFLFLVSATIALVGDLFFQLIRKRVNNPDKVWPSISTTVAFGLFLVNLALWINFTWNRRKSRAGGCRSRWKHGIHIYSFD